MDSLQFNIIDQAGASSRALNFGPGAAAQGKVCRSMKIYWGSRTGIRQELNGFNELNPLNSLNSWLILAFVFFGARLFREWFNERDHALMSVTNPQAGKPAPLGWLQVDVADIRLKWEQ